MGRGDRSRGHDQRKNHREDSEAKRPSRPLA